MDEVKLLILFSALNAVRNNKSAIERFVFDNEKDEELHVGLAKILVEMKDLERHLGDVLNYAENLEA